MMGFLKRHPRMINEEELFDGGFLLPAVKRDEIQKFIKEGKRGFITVTSGRDFKVYINQDAEAFVLGPKLGSGAFGKVYVVQNALNGKWHCMKRLGEGSLQDAELDILAQEGMYLSSETAKNLSDEERKRKGWISEDLFIGELIHGRNLAQLIEENSKKRNSKKRNSKKRALSFEQALALTISLAEAYESIQRKGYVHRDIKPPNVIVSLSQQKCTAIDFGLTRKKGENHALAGTPGYVPLEVLKTNKSNFAADIYAIGLTAGEIFASMADPVDYTIDYTIDNTKHKVKSIKKREDYLKIINDDQITNNKWLNKYKTEAIAKQKKISHVIFGAEDREYQKYKKLSKEQIALFKLLFAMTGAENERPTLKNVITNMHAIRLQHINARVENWVDFLETRKKLINAPQALDNFDAFALRLVDEKNKPDAKEVSDYMQTLYQALENKLKLTETFESFAKAKEETINLSLSLEQKKLAELMDLIQKLNIEFQNFNKYPRVQLYVKNLEKNIEVLNKDIEIVKGTLLNKDTAPSETRKVKALSKMDIVTRTIKALSAAPDTIKKMIQEEENLLLGQKNLQILDEELDESSRKFNEYPDVQSYIKKLKGDVLQLKEKIEKRKYISLQHDVLKKIEALSKACAAGAIDKAADSIEMTANLKKILIKLNQANEDYLKQNRKKLDKLFDRGVFERRKALFFADADEKVLNANHLHYELDALLKANILEPNKLEELIKEYRDLDTSAMGYFSKTSVSKVASMLQDAEKSLKIVRDLQKPSEKTARKPPPIQPS